MEHINFSIKKNLIYLKLNNNENVFNNGLVYFLNLDNFKNFFHISDINYIPNIKNYIIFVNKFRDNLDILEKLKNKFKFIAINLSFECFWFFLKLDTKCEEKIIYDKNNFDIKLKLKLNSYFYKQINNQKASHLENKEIEIKKNFILDNIDKLEYEIKQYKERILNESVEKLNGEYIKIKKNIKKLNEQIKKLDLNITNSNCSKQINIEEIYNKENILQEIRELKKKKLEIDKVIKSNYGIFESINLKIQEEKKIKESVKNYEKKLLYLKKQISDKEKLKEDFENLKEDFENLNNLILKGKKIYNKLLSENDYIRKNNILKNRKKYIAIVVHLYNINLWKEIYLYILNLKKFDICIDLYVNIAVDDEEDLLKKDFVNLKKKLEGINWLNKVIITNNDNKGMDSGGFLTSYLKILELKIDYDFIIKIHSKSNNNWRNLLLYSLLGNDKIIQNNFNLINKENIGMIGYQTMSLNENLPINKKSYKFMDEYLNFLNVEKKNNGFFIPGTIFIIKDYILKEYFTEEIISKIYKNFKSNYCGLFDNKLEERPHALERLYGLLVYNMNLNVISYDKN